MPADRDILDIDLGTLATIDATALNAETGTTGGPIPQRTVTATAEVANLGLGAPLPLVPSRPLLSVGTAKATVSASCPSTAGPSFSASSQFADIAVAGIEIDVANTPIDLNVLGAVRVQITPNFEQRTATSVRRAALHVKITTLLSEPLLEVDIAEAKASATDLPCAAPAAPTLGETAIGGGRASTPVTPVPGVAVTGCTMTLTPAGGTPVDLGATYNATAGTCDATLPANLAPGTYTVTTDVTDANGGHARTSRTFTIPGGGDDGTGGGGGSRTGGDGSGGGSSGTGANGGDAAKQANTSGANADGFAGSAADLALACTSRKLVLTDVQRAGRQVLLRGAAAQQLRGKAVRITLLANRKVVARPVVGQDGLFEARVTAPAAHIARSNAARYVASAGKQQSLPLKLNRRMATASIHVANGSVRFSGKVAAPYARTRQTVTLKRMVSCGRYETVGKAKLTANGRYTIRAAAPKGLQAAIYRADVRVATRPGGQARARSFTLPLAVNLPS